jgi:polyisoprenyl-phosphate glycosyltransferase
MKGKIDLSVIIPAYNEEEALPRTFRETFGALGNEPFTSEVIVVNDGSRDRTAQVCRKLSGTYRFTFVDKQKNQGYASAIKSGLQRAQGEYVCYLDADLQFSPRDMVRMFKLAKAKDAGVVIGEYPTKYYSWARKLRSKAYKYLFVRPLFGVKVNDVNSLKVLKRSVLEKIKLKGGLWIIDLELLFRFRKMGCRIYQVPISISQRMEGKSKTGMRSVIRTFFEMLRLRMDAWLNG